MRIVYRMRGLLGDATEDMVNTLDTGKGKNRLLLFHVCINLCLCQVFDISLYFKGRNTLRNKWKAESQSGLTPTN